MKKLLILLFSASLLIACSSEQPAETDYKIYEVNKNVRQILFRNAENNQVVTRIVFTKDGQLQSEKARNTLIEYSYDNQKITSLKKYVSDSLELRRTFEYKRNRPILIREFDANGNFRKKVVYEYDKDGNRTKGVNLSVSNDTLSKWDITFENGLAIKEVRHEYSADVDYEMNYLYDYNDSNELVSVTEMSAGEIFSKKYYKTYHSVSLQIAEVQYWNNVPDDSISMQYVFDEHGNWLLKRIFRNNETIRLQEREIVYYK